MQCGLIRGQVLRRSWARDVVLGVNLLAKLR
jgi:hypothetical protein